MITITRLLLQAITHITLKDKWWQDQISWKKLKIKKQWIPHNINLEMGLCSVAPSKSAQNFGVALDEEMKIDYRISDLTKTVHFHLKTKKNFSASSDPWSNKLTSHAIISYILDYLQQSLGWSRCLQLQALAIIAEDCYTSGT